ncbi:MAG: S24/S26 family peptidase [Acidobacteria bacterium]|nr:S24/S26 family peptidase [Acidobacteriota bacterium]
MNERLAAPAMELLARTGKSFEAPVSGSSMGSTIPEGSVVLVVPSTEPRRGDVVAFREGERVIAHRLFFAVRDHLVVVGDGYPVPDLPVPRERLLGRIERVRRTAEWEEVPGRPGINPVPRLAAAIVALALFISPLLARKLAAGMIRVRSLPERSDG